MTRVKKIIEIIIFLLVFLLIFGAVQDKFTPYREQDTNQANSFYDDTQANSVDVLAIGASTVLVGVSPLRMYEKSNIIAHVRANSRQSPPVLYLVAKDSLKYQKPKLMIFGARMLFQDVNFDTEEGFTRRGMDSLRLSLDKLKIAKAITDKSSWQTLSSYIFPIERYHSRWDELFHLQPAKAGKYDYMHGQYPVYKTMPIKDDSAEYMANKEKVDVKESSLKYYKKAVELCRENNIEVLFLTAPDIKWTSGKHEAVKAVCEELGVRYMDFNDANVLEATGLDWDYDYYNDHHVNARGSLKMTDYLCEYIEKEYGIKNSKISAELRMQFDKDLSKFKKMLKSPYKKCK